MVKAGGRPGMNQVARLAGVSHMTVSRVLNGHPNVSEGTRLRVQAAMDELGYRPNRAARALVTGRSGLIGAVTVGRAQFGPSSILYALEDAARARGYDLSTVSVPSPDPSEVTSAVERLMRQGVDAIVLLTPTFGADSGALPVPEIPLVVVESGGHGSAAAVTVDQLGGARTAVRHLLDLGHRRVWHLAGPSAWWEAQQRQSGWSAELMAAGIEPPPVLSGDWSAASGYDAGRVLSQIPDLTAVFVANDQMAMGLMHALRLGGRRIPDDVSVVGFDNVPEAAFTAPPLTTVAQDFVALGSRAMARLEAALTGASGGSDDVIPAELIVRQSTAPPMD